MLKASAVAGRRTSPRCGVTLTSETLAPATDNSDRLVPLLSSGGCARNDLGLMDEVIGWLLEGDSAVRHQTLRDLLDTDRAENRSAVASDGDAAVLLAARGSDGHWGRGFYQPRWTCSHYTLLELRGLELPGSHALAQATVELILQEKAADRGVSPGRSVKSSDVCVDGMFLNYASWFGAGASGLASVVDCLLAEAMPDGGFNCQRKRPGTKTASVHTIVSVLEGFTSYLDVGVGHRREEVRRARDDAVECLLARELFPVSQDRRGDPARSSLGCTIRPAGTSMSSVPSTPYEARTYPPTRGWTPPSPWCSRVDVRDGRWAASRGYPGQTHLRYPTPSQPNRWITLRALRVLRTYRSETGSVHAPPRG